MILRLFFIYFLLKVCRTDEAVPLNKALTYSVPPKEHIFVYTLNGTVILLDRRTGLVKWSRSYEPAILSYYDDEGPILIPDPVDGALYEFSSNPKTLTLLTKQEYSMFDHVKRSPAYHNSLLSLCTKSDSWHTLSFRTGEIRHKTTKDQFLTCPNKLQDDTLESLVIAQSQLTLTLRHPLTGNTMLNITYNTFVTHIEPDLPQNTYLRHVATTAPALLTFDKSNLLWQLDLDSPVVGLFSTWSPPNESSPKFLKRLPFSTFLFKRNQTGDNVDWKDKFNDPKLFSRALYIGKADAATLFAMDSIAEAGIVLRPVMSTSESRMLEGPLLQSEAEQNARLHEEESRIIRVAPFWLNALPGVYETPPLLKASWQGMSVFDPTRLISHMDSNFPLLPYDDKEQNSGLIPENDPRYNRITRFDVMLAVLIMITTAILGLLIYMVVFNFNSRSKVASKTGPSAGFKKGVDSTLSKSASQSSLESAGDSFSLLPAVFDNPDENGWAGWGPIPGQAEEEQESSESANMEMVRLHLPSPIGHGANGTMVYLGRYGKYETAVKRIVRQPSQEKHWQREHTILMQHQHPNLVRCYWTGSTVNFHYLVMQKCEFSLAEAVNHQSQVVTQRLADLDHPNRESCSNSIWTRIGLDKFFVLKQLIDAMAYLHRHDIVHRDLKPSNVLFHYNTHSREFRLVVGDFGLSRPLPAGKHEVTNSFNRGATLAMQVGSNQKRRQNKQSVMSSGDGIEVIYEDKPVASFTSGDRTSAFHAFGTLGWMAPELCDLENTRLTSAVDLFACGLLAFFILTEGDHAFDSQHDVASQGEEAKSTSSGGESQEDSQQQHRRALKFNIHHVRQMAIVDRKNPCLHRILAHATANNPLSPLLDTDELEQKQPQPFAVYEYTTEMLLGRDLVEELISFEPSERPAAKLISDWPIFWDSDKVMRFYCELSDFLDHKYDLGNLPDEEQTLMQLISRQQAFARELELCRERIFRGEWFSRLELVVVQDLIARRGYLGLVVQHLLRAIRNKRNHFWSLDPCVKEAFGANMAQYWNQRFPNLLPQLYRLGRLYLIGLPEFRDFLPSHGDKYASLAALRGHFTQVIATSTIQLELQQQQARFTAKQAKYSNLNTPPQGEQWGRKTAKQIAQQNAPSAEEARPSPGLNNNSLEEDPEENSSKTATASDQTGNNKIEKKRTRPNKKKSEAKKKHILSECGGDLPNNSTALT